MQPVGVKVSIRGGGELLLVLTIQDIPETAVASLRRNDLEG